MAQPRTGYLARPAPSGLADVVEIILDKGIVIGAYVRVSLVGIEILTIDARVVVGSVDTYLRFAEATNRLDLLEHGPPSLLDVVEEGSETVIENVATNVVEDKVEGVMDSVGDTLGKPAEDVARAAGRKALDIAEDVVGDPATGARHEGPVTVRTDSDGGVRPEIEECAEELPHWWSGRSPHPE